MKEYKSKIFRYDDLNWSEKEVQQAIQEAEDFCEKHGGTIEKLNGHVTRSSAFGPSLAYYTIPEHRPGLLVMWEEEEKAEATPPESEEEQEYELTIEYTYRMSVKVHAKSNDEAEQMAEKIATSDEIMERIDIEGNREIDYALCDARGRTIIDWN